MGDLRMQTTEAQARWEREQAFHDALADTLDPSVLPRGRPVVYDEVILSAAGIGPGMRVLDLGCGQGDLTLALLERGATVTAIDISPRMIEVARQRVALYAAGREARYVAAPIELTGLPAQSFDAIVGRWILHHLDLRAAAAEMARLLSPGGRMVFMENSGANPLLNLARDHVAGHFGVPRFGTADERPLIADDWRLLQEHFAEVRAEFPIFAVLALFDRQVMRYRSRLATVVCHGIDRAVGRVGRMRRYSYRVLVVAQGPPLTPTVPV